MKKINLRFLILLCCCFSLLTVLGCGGGGNILPSEDVTGSWVSRDFCGAGAMFNLVQSENGGIVGGLISDIDTDYEATGTLRGDNLELSGNDLGVSVSLSASVTSNTMSGSWSKSTGESGSFSALRVI